jgi:organic hydroperoxide reductase OsmC/OhrA
MSTAHWTTSWRPRAIDSRGPSEGWRRGIPASDGKLVGQVRGEIEKTEDGVLQIRRTHFTYRLRTDPSNRETVERALGFHRRRCPVARSIERCIDITTELELLPDNG